jgi:hypothetical protein
MYCIIPSSVQYLNFSGGLIVVVQLSVEVGTFVWVAGSLLHQASVSTTLLNCSLQFHISLLLDCLSRLQLLDKLHLQHFHLHNLLLGLCNRFQFLFDLLLNKHPSFLNFPSSLLFDLLFGNLLFHLNRLLLIYVLLRYVLHVLLETSFILLCFELSLCSFFSFRLFNRLNNLFLFLLIH